MLKFNSTDHGQQGGGQGRHQGSPDGQDQRESQKFGAKSGGDLKVRSDIREKTEMNFEDLFLWF